MAFTLASLLLGAALSLGFKVFVLVPTILFAAALICGIGIVQHPNVFSAILETLVVATAVQVGYFGASVARFTI
jgi:hypothetical protein